MGTATSFEPQVVLDALAERIEGAAVLAAAAQAPARVALVGGFVRDALLGRRAREVDLVVEGDAVAFARALGGEVVAHEQFGTARVSGADWSVDVAAARRESYPRPGALPVVEEATLEEDLRRRDFTVNAIALELAAGSELLAVERALDDLVARRLRILHTASFSDDPTRVLRLVRYSRRLGFEVETQTAGLAAAASLDSVSGARIGSELRLALEEPDPLALLDAYSSKLPISVDRDLLEGALALLPVDGEPQLLILAGVCGGVAPGDWVESLELGARERDVVIEAANAAALAGRIEAARSESGLSEVLRGVPVELVALAGARGAADAVRRWFAQLRHVRLEIDGDDLIAAGIAPGPELGRRLERTLARKLDGELDAGRTSELASALADGR
jgi:tRNA nucleotidyltransferase (CCA-adding enzyme)